MSITRTLTWFSESVEAYHVVTTAADVVALRWLGQGGFQIFYQNQQMMIDPYLTDYLALKYAGKEFDHQRMFPPPFDVDQIKDLDFLFSTHRHSDHMDPQAIPVILNNNPQCRFIAPRAESDYVVSQLKVQDDQTLLVNAGEAVDLAAEIKLEVTLAAHEQIQQDKNGNHHFLGYILQLGELTVYHSGDCVPFNGLEEMLRGRHIDVALLPVNGWDTYRQSRGVPGNFTFAEAAALCRNVAIPMMICQHFDMFDFNTVDRSNLERQTQDVSDDVLQVIVPEMDKLYRFNK